MSKAVAIQLLFVVIVMGITVFAVILVMSGWLGVQVPQISSMGCQSQKLSYCYELCKPGAPQPTWEHPESCGPQPAKSDCNCLGGTQ